MAEFNLLTNSLLGGEISPTMLGRTDQELYRHSCEKLRNQVLTKQGAIRRPGTFYVANAQSNTCRLIPFVYSKSDAWMLEISDSTIVGYKSDGSSATVTFMGSATAYTSITDLELIQYAQIGDVMYLVHPDKKPLKIVRTNAGLFEVYDFDYEATSPDANNIKRFPLRAMNTTSITITPSATTGSITLTASASIFQSGHVGSFFVLDNGTTIGAVKITGYTSGTQVSGTVYNTLGGTGAHQNWYEAAWSDYRGWPKTIGFFHDRLVYGGNEAQPDTFWYSMESNYDHVLRLRGVNGTTDYSGSNVATDPFDDGPVSTEINEIQWVKEAKTLFTGTVGAEYQVQKIDSSAGFGIDNAAIDSESVYGSGPRAAIRVGNALIFIDRSLKKVKEWVFDFDSNSYLADDISVVAQHLPIRRPSSGYTSAYGTIKEMVYQPSLETIWFINNNGELYGCLRDRKMGIAGWHSHTIGGELGQRTPHVQSIAVTPHVSGYDEVWLAVKRNINGATVTTIEVMAQPFEDDDLYVGFSPAVVSDPRIIPYFLDCAERSFASTATVTHSGFTHLAGETVQVLVDGHEHADVAVDESGVITLSEAANEVIAGFGYTSVIKPVPPDAGSPRGSSTGSLKRIHKLVIRFEKTAAAKIGATEDTLYDIDFSDSDQENDDQLALFSGLKEVEMPGNHSLEGQYVIVQDKPMPMTVISITAKGKTND